MKKLLGLSLSLLMIVGLVFIGEAISSNGSFTVKAQTVTVKRKKRGIGTRTYRGGKYVVKKTWKGTKWTAHKVKRGTKWTAHKTKRGTKATISRTKKIFR